jgi:hypothetical protein
MSIDDSNSLQNFMRRLSDGDLPEGYENSPLYKKGYTKGHQTGYMKGLREAWEQADVVIESVRNIIKLHDCRNYNDLED